MPVTGFARRYKVLALLVGIALAGLIGLPGGAQAFTDPATFLPGATDLSVKLSNFETLITGNGQTLSGIFTVTSINNAANPAISYWNTGQGGAQLNGFFTGLSSTGFGATGVNFTGGSFSIFAVPSGFSPSTTPGVINPAGQLCGGPCPTPWLTANFVPGIFDVPASTVTLAATFQSTNPQTGKGSGFLSVTGGTEGPKFDTNGFTFANHPAADIFLVTDITQCTNTVGGCSNGWPVTSQDPALARRVPMPGTLLLLGLGLLGLALVARRLNFNR